MKRNSIAAAAVLTLLTLGLTGCGSEDKKDEATDCGAMFDDAMGQIKSLYAEGEYAADRSSFVEECKVDPDAARDALASLSEPVAEEGDGEYVEEEAPIYDEADVVGYLHLKPADYDGEYTYTAGKTTCEISQVFTDQGGVEMYDDAQANVAATPEGNAGVEVGGDNQRTCMKLLVPALVGFEPSMVGE
jgi:hypothetical protein